MKNTSSNRRAIQSLIVLVIAAILIILSQHISNVLYIIPLSISGWIMVAIAYILLIHFKPSAPIVAPGILQRYTGIEMMKGKVFIPRLYNPWRVIGQIFPDDDNVEMELDNGIARWIIIPKLQLFNWNDDMVNKTILFQKEDGKTILVIKG